MKFLVIVENEANKNCELPVTKFKEHEFICPFKLDQLSCHQSEPGINDYSDIAALSLLQLI